MNRLGGWAWTLIGLAVAALLFFGWLRFVHDPNVRKEQEAKAVIDAQRDSIVVYRDAIKGLLVAAIKSDAAFLKRDTTIIRVAYIPQHTRDSLAVLSAIVRAARERGDSTVPVSVASQLDDEVKACTAKVDSIATELPLFKSACDQRVALRDSIIHDDSLIVKAKQSQIDALGVLAHVAAARFSPFLSGKYGLIQKRVQTQIGFGYRLFGHFSAVVDYQHTFGTSRADSIIPHSSEVQVGGTVTIH